MAFFHLLKKWFLTLIALIFCTGLNPQKKIIEYVGQKLTSISDDETKRIASELNLLCSRAKEFDFIAANNPGTSKEWIYGLAIVLDQNFSNDLKKILAESINRTERKLDYEKLRTAIINSGVSSWECCTNSLRCPSADNLSKIQKLSEKEKIEISNKLTLQETGYSISVEERGLYSMSTEKPFEGETVVIYQQLIYQGTNPIAAKKIEKSAQFSIEGFETLTPNGEASGSVGREGMLVLPGQKIQVYVAGYFIKNGKMTNQVKFADGKSKVMHIEVRPYTKCFMSKKHSDPFISGWAIRPIGMSGKNGKPSPQVIRWHDRCVGNELFEMQCDRPQTYNVNKVKCEFGCEKDVCKKSK
ncbi:MAG: hypothetical protein ACXWRE_15390 [Pseudobdellovibrionaceae bacterium]